MFEALTKGFREAQNRLAGLTELDESNIKSALREVRLSLLEADVELGVVKRFLAHVEEKALGQTVQTRIRHSGQTHRVGASEQFVKICHDELVEMMSSPAEPLVYAPSGRTGVMMVGLQGSGKTTSAAKLARWFSKQGKQPLLVAADMQRPAAVEQLKVLGGQIDVPVFNLPDKSPVEICTAADAEAKRLGRDVIIYDTAGRLAIDEPLMQELGEIKSRIEPENIYLVVDAMIGQDAVQTAKSFNERLGITGVLLTKLDGDARGGAALSVKEVTGAPIVFVGMGETTDKLETFRPEGMAGRVLGMGDVVGLIQDFEEVVDQKQAEQDAMRMMQGEFTLEDFLNQVRMIQRMGSLKDLVDKIPGLGGMIPPGAEANLDDRELVRIEAMIQSMTRERAQRSACADPRTLAQPSHRQGQRAHRAGRGRAGSEVSVHEADDGRLRAEHGHARKRPRHAQSGHGAADATRGQERPLRSECAGRWHAGGMPGMPGMPGMGLPGMGFPGMGLPGMGPTGGGEDGPRMKTLSKAERNAKKNQRKRERAARKKGKGKR